MLRLIIVLAPLATLVMVAGHRRSSPVLPPSGNLQEPICKPSFTAVGNTCLSFFNNLLINHTEAQIVCEAMEAHLVVIDTSQKLNDVADYINNYYDNIQTTYWIEGNRDTANQWLFPSKNLSLPMGTPFWGTSKNGDYYVQRPLDDSGDCLTIPFDKFYYFTETTCDLELHSPLCEQDSIEFDWGCGHDYEGTEGSIASPNYPDVYPNNADCHWTVTSPTPAGITTITVTFESFNTEASDRDVLEIRDGSDSNAPLLVTLQGELTSIDDVVSTSNSLFFYFRTDYSFQHSGFMLNWVAEFPCPPPYIKFELDCFAFVFEPENFSEAKVTCYSMNGQLGKITNAEQLRRLYGYIHDLDIAYDSFWIGGSDKDDEGNFFYEDGTAVPQGTPFWGTTGENSEIQEPDGSEEENCVALLAEGFHFLRDVPCTTQLKFICQPF